jgi:hypothetical protein
LAEKNKTAEIVRVYFTKAEWDWLMTQPAFLKALDQPLSNGSKIQVVRAGVDLLEKRATDLRES